MKEFKIRPIRISDAKDYLECHDTHAMKGFMTTPTTLAQAKKEIKEKIAGMRKKKPSHESFAITINNEFAGWIEINNLNQKHAEHKANLGYCISPKFRKKGLATKAVKRVTAHAFKKFKLKRIDAWCRTFNKASARVLEKAGYKHEGTLRKNKKKDGRYLDDMVWAKVK